MLYLHIGRQKTGTTAIQRFFDQNRERLKEIGVCYPLAVPFGGIAHHGLAHALDRKDGRAKTPKSLHPRFLEAFQKSIRGARDIIVSSEGFGKLDPAWITDFFPSKTTTVVVYIREQLSFAMSSYAQKIQAQVSTVSFEEFAGRSRPDYSTFLDRWSGIYGLDHIRVGVFECPRLLNGDIIDDFLKRVGVSREGLLALDSDPNPSLSPHLLALKRLLNHVISDMEHREWGLFKVFQKLTLEHPPGSKGFPVAADLADSYRAQFQESNEHVQKKYFGTNGPLFRNSESVNRFPAVAFDYRKMLDQLLQLEPRAYDALLRLRSDQIAIEKPTAHEREILSILKSGAPA